ncbi:hypothetical protein SCHPADRAFT_676774 [Schizopora paradoxa]|uniref:Uncharacterized protein n=1 Tax=Schizopora paradoxa TaxID=27342 RepID=A0A0H2R5H9_9AGAM|nr:hypothetical protein SCHPADRAFT_746585 [Schizopora paradoxa]KLO06805.1 hypothetical protein SCHPADRAFT_676774 [Schizopora paradoxa]
MTLAYLIWKLGVPTEDGTPRRWNSKSFLNNDFCCVHSGIRTWDLRVALIFCSEHNRNGAKVLTN